MKNLQFNDYRFYYKCPLLLIVFVFPFVVIKLIEFHQYFTVLIYMIPTIISIYIYIKYFTNNNYIKVYNKEIKIFENDINNKTINIIERKNIILYNRYIPCAEYIKFAYGKHQELYKYSFNKNDYKVLLKNLKAENIITYKYNIKEILTLIVFGFLIYLKLIYEI